MLTRKPCTCRNHASALPPAGQDRRGRAQLMGGLLRPATAMKPEERWPETRMIRHAGPAGSERHSVRNETPYIPIGQREPNGVIWHNGTA